MGKTRISIFIVEAPVLEDAFVVQNTVKYDPSSMPSSFKKIFLYELTLNEILEMKKRFLIQLTAGQLEHVQVRGGGFSSFFSIVSYLYTSQPLNPCR